MAKTGDLYWDIVLDLRKYEKMQVPVIMKLLKLKSSGEYTEDKAREAFLNLTSKVNEKFWKSSPFSADQIRECADLLLRDFESQHRATGFASLQKAIEVKRGRGRASG